MSEGPLRATVARLRHWRDEPLVAEVLDTPPGRLVASLLDLSVRDRALTLAGQAFIALLPLGILLATVLSAQDGRAVGGWLVDRYGLTGTTAEAVDQLFARPPDATSGISLLGVVVLLVSVNSFARTLQRTYEAAWELPSRAPRRGPNRFLSLIVLLTLIVSLGWVPALVRALPMSGVLGVAVQLAVAVPIWVLIADLLLSRRIDRGRLVPGAVVSGVAQVLATWSGAVWVPHLVAQDAARYGVVGVAVALVSWLVVLAFVLTACATTGAWAARELDARRAD